MEEKKWSLDRLTERERALLRRNSGRPLGADTRTTGVFYKAVDSVPEDPALFDQWFVCLCMDCRWRTVRTSSPMRFEECLRKVYWSENSESLKRRILSAMDIPWGEDGYLAEKLDILARQIQMRRGMLKPDFSALADDLKAWNSPDRHVQRKWIETIFSMPEDIFNLESEETEYAD